MTNQVQAGGVTVKEDRPDACCLLHKWAHNTVASRWQQPAMGQHESTLVMTSKERSRRFMSSDEQGCTFRASWRPFMTAATKGSVAAARSFLALFLAASSSSRISGRMPLVRLQGASSGTESSKYNECACAAGLTDREAGEWNSRGWRQSQGWPLAPYNTPAWHPALWPLRTPQHPRPVHLMQARQHTLQMQQAHLEEGDQQVFLASLAQELAEDLDGLAPSQSGWRNQSATSAWQTAACERHVMSSPGYLEAVDSKTAASLLVAALQIADDAVMHILLLLAQEVSRDGVQGVAAQLVVSLDGLQQVKLDAAINVPASFTQMQFDIIIKHDGIYIFLSLLVLFSVQFCFQVLFQSAAATTGLLCWWCISGVNSMSFGLYHCSLI
ncbi:MAG: hypothetical protein FRX49_04288 [Trebouxia sp. A1-2]|nr:MAG: hypothetical protein FRX49_04288 [Trebouxia sp. A1-2]